MADNKLFSMIKKNTTLPCKKRIKFANYKDNDTKLDIYIFEGEGTTTLDKNIRKLDGIRICGITPINGVLTVTASEKLNNNTKQLKIELK